MRKTISLLLALVMVFSCLSGISLSASALTLTPPQEELPAQEGERTVSYLTDLALEGYLGDHFEAHIQNWLCTALENNPNIIEQIEKAQDNKAYLSSMLSDAGGVISKGIYKISASETGGLSGNALAWTLLSEGSYNDTDFRYIGDPGALADWQGATELWYYFNGSDFGTKGIPVNVAFEESNSDGERESWKLKNGATVYYCADGSTWTQTTANDAGRMVLPAGFCGWVRLPLNTDTFYAYWASDGNYSGNALDLFDVHQFQLCVDGNSTAVGKTAYMDAITIVGDLNGEALSVSNGADDTALSVWSMDNLFTGETTEYTGDIMSWYGEFPGKLLTGMAFSFRLSPSEELYAAADELITALENAQGEDGYLGIYTGNARMGGNGTNWDVWAHYHAIYALLEWYNITGEQRCMDIAIAAADYVYDYFVSGGKSFYSAGCQTMNYAISHSFALLYQQTGEQKYLDAAKQIVDIEWESIGNWMNNALEGKDYYESDLPRWEALHTIITLGVLYEITGESKYYTALESIWWSIVKTDRHNNGGFTTREQAVGDPYAVGAIEYCCSVAWTALTTEYLQLSKEAYAADELELTYYNTVYGSLLADDTHVTYDTPMNGDRVASQIDIAFQYNSGSPEFNCCQANLSRGLGQLSQWAILSDSDSLYVNFYGASVATTKTSNGKSLTLTQETSYPLNGAVKLTLTMEESETFTLALRIPTWAAGTTVSVNGEALSGVTAGEYLYIDRQWSNGDVIAMELAMNLHYWLGEGQSEGLTSIYYGPILLACDSVLSGVEEDALDLSIEALNTMTVSDGAAEDCWLTFDVENGDGNTVRLVDFASAGKAEGSTYTTWLPVSHTMSQIGFSVGTNPLWNNSPELAAFDFGTVEMSETLKPSDFGWSCADESDWSAAYGGDFFYLSNTLNEGISCDLPDTETFTVSVTVKVEQGSAALSLLGQTLNLSLSDTDTLYCANTDSTIAAEGGLCKVTFRRLNGGDLTVLLEGEGSDTVTELTLTAGSGSTLSLGSQEAGSGVWFCNMETAGAKSVYGYGWHTDQINGTMDFAGWYSTDGKTILGVYADTTGNHRIWKQLLGRPSNYTASVTLEMAQESSCYVRTQGQTVEFSTAGGNGNQIYVSVNGVGQGWVDAQNNKATIRLTRKDGANIGVRVEGAGNANAASYIMVPTSTGVDYELGIMSGAVLFRDVQVAPPVADYAPGILRPGDFGWQTDTTDGAQDFSGWTASGADSMEAVYAETTGNHRIWKSLLTDQENFTLKLTADLENESSLYVKALGQTVELDSRGGNGNQVYVKLNGSGTDWLTASGNKVTVYLTREAAGNLSLTLVGEENSTPVEHTMTPSEENENVELGIYAGSAAISGITVTDPNGEIEITKTPGEFGWETDSSDFSGWTATDEANLKANYSLTVNGHRVWKSLLESTEDFSLELDLSSDSTSSGYVKVLGVTLELDSRGGNGNQTYIKLQGAGYDWIDAKGCAAHVAVTRTSGGKLTFAVVGEGSASGMTLTADAAETGTNVELGLYAGAVSFNNITTAAEEGSEDETIPVSFSGDSDWLYADATPDMTHSFTFQYDLTLTAIASVTTADTWADNIDIYFRNPVADDSIRMTVQAYCNGSNKYQIAVNSQVWDGSTWGDRPFLWSGEQDSPITNVRVLASYDAESGDFSWEVTDKDTGNVLSTYTFSGSNVTDDIKTCTAAEVKLYRNPTTAVVSNAVLTYGAGSAEEEPTTKTESVVWTLADGWVVDGEDRSLILQSLTGTQSVLKENMDLSGEFSLTTTWKFDSLIESDGNRGGGLGIFLKDAASNDSLFIRLARWRNSSAHQFYASVQYWNNGTASWTNFLADGWLGLSDKTDLIELQMQIQKDVDTGNLVFTFTDPATAAQMGSFTVTPESVGDSNAQTRYLANIINNTALQFVAGMDGDETSFTLTNPVIVSVPVMEEPTEKTIKIGHTVSFDSDLRVNYRVKYTDLTSALPNYVTDGAYLVVEKDLYLPNGTMDVATTTLYPDLVTDANRMVFSLGGIQSVEMGSELRAVLHVFDADGNEYYTPVDVYSVLTYAEANIPTTTNAAFRTLLVDLLNYGAAAQIYFGRNTDNLVNAGIDAYQQYATTQLSEELNDGRTYIDNDREITAVTAMGFSVVFADKTEMIAKLTLADGYTKEDITCVKVLNSKGEVMDTITNFTEASDGRLQVTYYGVKSIQMRELFQFVAYVGDKVASQNVAYSVEAYVKSNISSSNTKLADMVLKCIYYGDSAYAYFKK